VADLLVAFHDHAEGSGRGLAEEVLRRKPDAGDAVQHQGGVEDAKLGIGDVGGAGRDRAKGGFLEQLGFQVQESRNGLLTVPITSVRVVISCPSVGLVRER